MRRLSVIGMSDPPLYIHAGAHRTGTSSFQMCLHENLAQLRARGWALIYPRRDGIPSGDRSLRLPRPRDVNLAVPIKKTSRRLTASSGGRPLILSEENIPGRMFHFFKGQFYPAAEKRCEVLRAAWPGPIAHVLLVVRPYDQLFVSGYRKRAEENLVPPFDVLRQNYMRMDRGWSELVNVLRDVLRPERLTIVPYDLRGSSSSLLERLVPGLEGAPLQEPVSAINVSATDRALIALQDHLAKQDPSTPAVRQSIMRAHAHNTTPLGVAAFSEEEVAHWSARYGEDLERIAAMDGVTLISSD